MRFLKLNSRIQRFRKVLLIFELNYSKSGSLRASRLINLQPLIGYLAVDDIHALGSFLHVISMN
jgi:hypothetical protein